MADIVIKLVNGELAGKTMQGLTKEVNAAALATKKAEVGTKEWIDAHAKLDKAKALQADMKKQIDSTSKASDTLKQQFLGILNQIPGFSAFTGILGKAKGGVGGLTSGFGLLRGAIIATGIGALLLLITGLVTWFSKTEKGANMISGAFKAMGAIVDTLLNRLWNIQDTIKSFFSNPLKFFKDLGSDIKQAATEAYDLVQLFDALEDAKRDLDLTNAQTESAVDRLLLQSRNVALSFKERMELLDQASQLEKEQFQARVKYSTEYLLAVGREAAAAEKAGTMNDDLADKLQQARIDVINLDKESIALQEKIANRRSALVEKQEAENERIRKAREKQQKDELAAMQNIEDLKIEVMEDGVQKEIAKIELDTQRKIEALIGSEAMIAEQKALLKQQELMLIQAVIDKAVADQEVKDKQAKERQTQRDHKELEEKKRIEQAKQDLAMMTKDAEASIASEVAGFGTNLLAAQAKDQKEAKRIRKAGTVLDIGLNLQRELAGISANASLNPLNAVPGGSAIVAAQAAIQRTLAKVRAGIGIASVLAFKRGGYVQGPSHDQGGIPGRIGRNGPQIEFEGGEFFFSKDATRAIGVDNLSRMNDQFTRKFAAGGPVNPFVDRAPISRGSTTTASSASSGSSLTSGLEQKIDRMNSLLEQWPKRLKVYVVAREVNDAIAAEAKIKDDADV